MYQSFKMALKAIAGNKMRSFLTVLGVIIGVVAIVVLVAIAQGATNTISSSIESMGTNMLTVSIRARRQNPVTMAGLDELSQDVSIAAIAPYTSVSGTIKAGVNTYDDGSILATTPQYADIRMWEVAQGRFITQPDVDNRIFAAVIGSEAATEMFGTTDVVGETFSISGYTFTVVGVLKENGDSLAGSQDNMVVIPFTLGQRMSNNTKITSFYVSAVSAEEVDFAKYAIETWLDKMFSHYSSSSSQYTVYSQTEILDTLNETTATLTLMMGGIAAISLLVGGIGIMNIMLVSVSERTREIGIRKAIGASRWNILSQFLIEALVVSLMGGLLGLAASSAVLHLLEEPLTMKLTISSTVAIAAIGFSVIIGVVFGIYPANRASKLKPIDALHYEG